jgi:predicted O-methyltransferase YrrM
LAHNGRLRQWPSAAARQNGRVIHWLRAIPQRIARRARQIQLAQHVDDAMPFIDADKAGYPAYYEELLGRLRPGGLIALDNVLLGGRVLDPAYQEEHHRAMRRLNDLIAADERVEATMLTVRDGLTLARKR